MTHRSYSVGLRRRGTRTRQSTEDQESPKEEWGPQPNRAERNRNHLRKERDRKLVQKRVTNIIKMRRAKTTRVKEWRVAAQGQESPEGGKGQEPNKAVEGVNHSMEERDPDRTGGHTGTGEPKE